MKFCILIHMKNLMTYIPRFFFLRFGVYVPLCCFHQEGRTQQAPTDCSFSEPDGTDGSLQRPKDFLALVRENLREQFFSPTHVPAHTCPPSPELIRSEVEELKSDFNRRIKEVLFNSLFSAYYVAFLPLCFVQVSMSHKTSDRHESTSFIELWIIIAYFLSVFLPIPRKHSTMTCAGHVSTWSWCGSTHS